MFARRNTAAACVISLFTPLKRPVSNLNNTDYRVDDTVDTVWVVKLPVEFGRRPGGLCIC